MVPKKAVQLLCQRSARAYPSPGSSVRSATGYPLEAICLFFLGTFVLSRGTCLPGARGKRTLQIFFLGFCSFPTETIHLSLRQRGRSGAYFLLRSLYALSSPNCVGTGVSSYRF